MTESLVIVAGRRTAFGSFGGSMKDLSPTELGLAAAKAAIAESKVAPESFDHVIVGNVLHSAPDSIYTPRHLGLKAGIPVPVPALGINRLCGSGFQVLVEAYQQMATGDSKIALVGGVENMSMAPYVLRGVRWGNKMGNAPVIDTMTESLTDLYAQAPMAITAENLAEKYGIKREESDAFALQSQKRYSAARERGVFKDEIAPVPVADRKGNTVQLTEDEHARPDTTPEILAKLKPVFKKDGQVTAGNASGIVDGAAMLVVATESEARKRGFPILGRMVAYGVAGCEPKLMGIGPVPAAQIALKRAGMSIGQMDLIEVNEAFAPQALSVQRELGFGSENFNVNGGAIAVGHPLAASGTRIVLTLLKELKRRGKKYGLGAACIGGGQGIAVILEV